MLSPRIWVFLTVSLSILRSTFNPEKLFTQKGVIFLVGIYSKPYLGLQFCKFCNHFFHSSDYPFLVIAKNFSGYLRIGSIICVSLFVAASDLELILVGQVVVLNIKWVNLGGYTIYNCKYFFRYESWLKNVGFD